MKKILPITIFLLLYMAFPSNSSKDKLQLFTANKLKSTSLSRGTIFIAPNGKGDKCTEKEPCHIKGLDLYSPTITLQAGDVVFFRGGIYSYSMKNIRRIYLKGGTKDKPIIYESYPNELAIFDGAKLSNKNEDKNKKEWREGRLQLHGNYIKLRNIEVRNMPQYGIRIFGNHNIVEGCNVHHNSLSGIEILNKKDLYSSKDTGGSYNMIQHNIIHHNSDVNLTYGNYNDGGNADGVTIHSGIDNVIRHNIIFNNSDDGIDTYKSMHTCIEYNLVYYHGQGQGNANGLKLGGPDPKLSINTIAMHNILFQNKGFGITVHGKENNTTILYNTTYDNEKAGYAILEDTVLSYNISYEDKEGDVVWSQGLEQVSNSWQKAYTEPIFLNFNHLSNNFLHPTKESNLTNIGAYASEKR